MTRLGPQCFMNFTWYSPHYTLGRGQECTEQWYVSCPRFPEWQGQSKSWRFLACVFTRPVNRCSSFPLNTAPCAQTSCLFQRCSYSFDFFPLAFELTTEWLVLSKIWDVWSYCFSDIKTCSHFPLVWCKWLHMNLFILRIKGYTKNIVKRTLKSFLFSPDYLHP